jgi:hypothetical protein
MCQRSELQIPSFRPRRVVFIDHSRGQRRTRAAPRATPGRARPQ